jgi:hypothetical protein
VGLVEREPEVIYNPQFRVTPFVVRFENCEELMTVNEFKAFYAECENALQAYEGEKIARKLALKARYEAARERRQNV